MAKQVINNGTIAGDGTGENLFSAFDKVNDNFTEVYDEKAPLASPTFTGTVAGITKSMVGLGNVDNTADTAKPVSTAQQTALNLKANLASPTFSGIVTTAGQIAFPATANPSSNANTLDDYEEGAFTPILSFNDLSVGITYSIQQGRYVKVGGLVTAWVMIALSSKGSSTGVAQITLPFTSPTISNQRWANGINYHNLTGNYSAVALSNYNQAWIYKGVTRAVDTDFANDSTLYFTLQYEAP